MLPRLLCEQLCSLNPDEDRLAFSVIWKMTETGEVRYCLNVWLMFVSCQEPSEMVLSFLIIFYYRYTMSGLVEVLFAHVLN